MVKREFGYNESLIEDWNTSHVKWYNQNLSILHLIWTGASKNLESQSETKQNWVQGNYLYKIFLDSKTAGLQTLNIGLFTLVVIDQLFSFKISNMEFTFKLFNKSSLNKYFD